MAILLSILLLGCVGQEKSAVPQELDREPTPEDVVPLYVLNTNLDAFIGKKVWVSGFYGDDRFTGDVGFLVLDFTTLITNEKLPLYSFARLDGDVPPYEMNGAEMVVYGEVKDFAKTYNAYTLQKTPLITVEEYHLTPAQAHVAFPGLNSPLSLKFAGMTPLFLNQPASPLQDGKTNKKAKEGDRVLIICGTIDDNNSHVRFKDGIKVVHDNCVTLGFSDTQIEVCYADGRPIGNIVDRKASRKEIIRIIEQYKNEMTASSTLLLFVTGHGNGHWGSKPIEEFDIEEESYTGARPAFSGEPGKTYPERIFKVDMGKKVYKEKILDLKTGTWKLHIDKDINVLILYKGTSPDEWKHVGIDSDDNGKISETEVNKDIDGDGKIDYFTEFDLDSVDWNYPLQGWDTDKDGEKDVRVRWVKEKNQYIIERHTTYLKDGKEEKEWKEMEKDKNGDFVIDKNDGGIDWNLDGDTDDQMGFHEGIWLWGDDVLWDDELAEMLKPLHEKGVHIFVVVSSCHSGGFLGNLQGIVEKVVAFADEDQVNFARDDCTGRAYQADLEAFAKNLKDIDIEGWNFAFEEAQKADKEAAAKNKEKEEKKAKEGIKIYPDGGIIIQTPTKQPENTYVKWEKPCYKSSSIFIEENGYYAISIEIPESLKGDVYALEISFGLQWPRWEKGSVLKMPEGFSKEKIPGGIRIKSEPFPLTPLAFRVKGEKNAENMRIELTDKDHKSLGYIVLTKVSKTILSGSTTLWPDPGARPPQNTDKPFQVGIPFEITYPFGCTLSVDSHEKISAVKILAPEHWERAQENPECWKISPFREWNDVRSLRARFHLPPGKYVLYFYSRNNQSALTYSLVYNCREDQHILL